MRIIEIEKKYRAQLRYSGFKESVVDLLSYYVASYGENSKKMLVESPGEIAFSYNDIYIIYHPFFHGSSSIVEVANPYANEEFALITYETFCECVDQLLVGKSVSKVGVAFSDARYLSDSDDI